MKIGPLAIHLLDAVALTARERLVERVLEPEPRAQHQPRLRPRKLPRDCAQAADPFVVAMARTSSGPAADVHPRELGMRRGGAEIVHKPRVFVDDGAIAVRGR